MENRSTPSYHDPQINASRPLLDTCIAFAVLETAFVIAFIVSWHFNRGNNSNNTKGVYGLMLIGYVFCFGGPVIGIRKYDFDMIRSKDSPFRSKGYHGRCRPSRANAKLSNYTRDVATDQSARSHIRSVDTVS